MGINEAGEMNANSEREDYAQKLPSILFGALELRDVDTGVHSKHVALITKKFAGIYHHGFQENQLDLIHMAALIHDIGKIGIRDNILNKPGKLSETEYALMKKHPQLGYELIEHLSLHSIVRDAVLYHHENYDGSGYPKGLKGTDIPLISRLVRITDYYEGLITDRPYRSALTQGKAIKIMDSSSQHFDPKLFNIFINNLQDIV